MGNMGYFRFQNTLDDLRDCWIHIDDDNLSKDENNARAKLVKMCQDILDDLGIESEEK